MFHEMLSAVLFAVACWWSSIRAGYTNRLDELELIRKVESITGRKWDISEGVVHRRSLNKLLSIMGNPDHPVTGQAGKHFL